MTAIYSGNTAGEIGTNYLNLLITQLRNQNPLEPLDNNQMASQLAQLSELEHLENMDGTFDKVLLATQMNQATELIGRDVTFTSPADGTAVTETVSGVRLIDGEIVLYAGEYGVPLDAVQTIQ